MYKKKKIVAIIPARQGSKGIKNKNIVKLNNKPLISYTIGYAQKSKIIDKTFVSTDGAKIGKISKYYGAEIIDRPKKLATDTATSESALIHSIKYIDKILRYKFDIIVFLQATSPLRKIGELDKAIKFLIDKKLDTVFSSNRYLPFIWKKRFNKLKPVNFILSKRKRRQDIFEVNETGSFYINTKKSFLKNKSRFGKKIHNYDTGYHSMLEIDCIDDLKYINILLKTVIPKRYKLYLP